MNNQEILDLPENSSLKEVKEYTRSAEGAQMIHSSYSFENYNIHIIKGQWTKTQKAYSIRVDNYSTGKNHMLQIPMNNLKVCMQFISILKNSHECFFWTGHHLSTGSFIKQF